jgi:hypothetical protein
MRQNIGRVVKSSKGLDWKRNGRTEARPPELTWCRSFGDEARPIDDQDHKPKGDDFDQMNLGEPW